ncbi:MAG TPA: SGNH/GDSL hydrolase family protein, partial [Pyrinomonadaceae bacterium]|nr:SGNH/GDSL hydrolase family protein [Pyrinomonadaceae bacterium]
NATANKILPDTPGKLLVYGDSIAVGGDLTTGTRDGWTPKLRTIQTESVIVEGFGSRSLSYDASSSTSLNSLVGYIKAAQPAKIWLAIGTNDYGLSTQPASAFKNQYAALLDALHTALPNAQIYAQTPLLRSSESANASGSTLGDYRNAIVDVVSTRTSYTILVDGTKMLALADLEDGLHPSAAGHLKYAQFVAGKITEVTPTPTPTPTP